ncbi:MAG TPA: translocase [Planctomycetaceae bacterium]|nr:translocase [Planctomycetaceae bacterium]
MITRSHIWHLAKTGGRLDASRISRWGVQAAAVISRSEALRGDSDTELLRRGRELRWQAKTQPRLADLLIEAFALVREAARRQLGFQHFHVQIQGGIALFEGHVAEMQTGEGKTLTATLPAFLRGLTGRGCHIVTVNDYLAGRDAETMGPIFERLGLSVGCIQTPMQTEERRAAYAKDITYGTAKEIGFDFLRDRLRTGADASGGYRRRDGLGAEGRGGGPASEAPVQRAHYFALIDEADSILIDEGRTPLIIGLTQPNTAATVNLLRWSQRASLRLERDIEFIFEPDRRTAYLTDRGCRKVLLMAKPSLLDCVDAERMYKHVEQALSSRYGFQRDRDYVVVEDKIVIVDESTGRQMDGRKWQDGLHQAIEAKELVPITAATGQAARVTVQTYFRQYEHVCGMTGTAVQARRELHTTYAISVCPIPTNRPCIRTGAAPRIFATLKQKRHAVVQEIIRMHAAGRAVLVGTPSVEASEALGRELAECAIEHQILNARFDEREAEIVAQAGQAQAVTIATNMAGRGTDIQLDETVRTSGGLHVIATEMHSSARIDRQLVGRAARQGDPGSYQFFLSLEDELLRCLKPEKLLRLRNSARPNADGELSNLQWLRLFRRTQRFLERMHRKERKNLLRHERQRSEAHNHMGLDPYLELTD